MFLRTYILVSIATRQQAERHGGIGVTFPEGTDFSRRHSPKLLRGPPSLPYQSYMGLYPRKIQHQKLISSVEVKHVWSYSSTLQYGFTEW